MAALGVDVGRCCNQCAHVQSVVLSVMRHVFDVDIQPPATCSQLVGTSGAFAELHRAARRRTATYFNTDAQHLERTVDRYLTPLLAWLARRLVRHGCGVVPDPSATIDTALEVLTRSNTDDTRFKPVVLEELAVAKLARAGHVFEGNLYCVRTTLVCTLNALHCQNLRCATDALNMFDRVAFLVAVYKQKYYYGSTSADCSQDDDERYANTMHALNDMYKTLYNEARHRHGHDHAAHYVKHVAPCRPNAVPSGHAAAQVAIKLKVAHPYAYVHLVHRRSFAMWAGFKAKNVLELCTCIQKRMCFVYSAIAHGPADASRAVVQHMQEFAYKGPYPRCDEFNAQGLNVLCSVYRGISPPCVYATLVTQRACAHPTSPGAEVTFHNLSKLAIE